MEEIDSGVVARRALVVISQLAATMVVLFLGCDRGDGGRNRPVEHRRIVLLVFFLLYQQLENHLLQPMIFARTVKLNPLAVFVAILVAVELADILGALLAIPIAGIVQILARDVWDGRRGRPRTEPTVGPERTPVSQAGDDDARDTRAAGAVAVRAAYADRPVMPSVPEAVGPGPAPALRR